MRWDARLVRQVSHDLDMKLQVYSALLLLALVLLADFLEAARPRSRASWPHQQPRPRGGAGYRRKKVSLLKSVKVYYDDPLAPLSHRSPRTPCRRSRHGRKYCQRPRKLRLEPSRSDPIADYENEIATSTAPTTTTIASTTTTTESFSAQDFGPYFSQIAKAFAQSLESGAILNQVQYNSQADNKCPKLPDNPPVCASNFAMHECWSPGQKDASDCQGDFCCFNGCENVCFRPAVTKVESTLPPPPIEEVAITGNSCPKLPTRSRQACQNARPNCWSAGQFDLDCPQSGLCCFDGCVNRCISTTPPALNQTDFILPVKEVTTTTTSQPLEEYYYYNNNNHPSVMTTSGYSSINQREPSLVLHIYGPPQSKPQVLFGELPPTIPRVQQQPISNPRLARQIKKKSQRFHLKSPGWEYLVTKKN